MITHHAPVRQHIVTERYQQSGFADAFFNDREADCVDPLRLWVYGHTHRSADVTINSTRVVSNQVGYLGQDCGFRPNMKITLYDDGTVTVTEPSSAYCPKSETLSS